MGELKILSYLAVILELRTVTQQKKKTHCYLFTVVCQCMITVHCYYAENSSRGALCVCVQQWIAAVRVRPLTEPSKEGASQTGLLISVVNKSHSACQTFDNWPSKLHCPPLT